jgi:signal transduction histidine kinase/uncharacterized protein YhfF
MTLLNQVAAATAGEVGETYLLALVRELTGVLEAEAALVGDPPVAVWPTSFSEAVDAPSLRVGPIVVVRPGRSLGDEDRQILQILATRADLELERRRHDAALARLVETADEERRRIGRDLHDGVQQRLVALGQRLDLARRALAEGDAARAEALVTEARGHATDAGRDLRELARGLHPVGLTERGLDGALKLLAGRSPLPLRLDALPARRLPDAIELTVFYIVSEALSNASRYSEATEVRVEIVQRHRTLHVVVADDGVGGADDHAGSGLRGLGDRVTALGGTLKVVSPPGEGTRLEASIPLAPWRDARDPFLEFGHERDDGAGERSIGRVLAGTKTATVSLAREWELEGGTPRIGQVLPVRDHRGARRCEVVVTRVAVLPFGEISEDIMRAESAGAQTLEQWREGYYSFYAGCREHIATLLGEPDWELTEDEPMVITWFRLLES